MANEKQSLKVNAVLNIIRQICAIIFPLITFPYVSRTLGVDAYGEVNFSNSIVSYISLIAGLGVSSYAIREGARIREKKDEFEKFSNEVFSINVSATFAAYIILTILLLMWGKLQSYRTLVIILSINVLLTTLGTDWINTIYEDFGYLTIRYIVCQSIAVVTTLLLEKKPEDVVLYAIFSNLGTILANTLNIFYIRKKLHIHLKFTFKMNIAKHFQPIMLLFGNMISSMIYLYSDTTMLGVMVGDAAVGYYTVSSKIYSLIKQLINAVSNVLIPRLSHDLENDIENKTTGNVNAVLGILTVIVFPIAVGIICMGKEIIYFIAGQEYVLAYPALAILSIALIFSTYACIFVSVIMLAQRMDREILFASGVSAFVNIALNAVLIPKYSYNAAAFTTLISEFIILIWGIYYTRKVITVSIGKYILLAAMGVIEVFLICFATKHFIQNKILTLILSVIICGIVYGTTIGIAFFTKKNTG